jgi:hypothetical protein
VKESRDIMLMGDTDRILVQDATGKLHVLGTDDGAELLDLSFVDSRLGSCVSPVGDIVILVIVDRLYALDGRAER